VQAVRAAERLGSFDAVWASPLQRAAHTAAVIAESIGVGPVQVHPDLMEAGFGPWQGLTIAEIEQGWPGYLAERRRPEGAEPAEQVVARGLAALRHVAASAPGGELVVTHGGLVRSVCASLDRHDVHLPNLGACWFQVRNNGEVQVGEVVRLLDGPATGGTL
jgi:broad specificity phosphatase PhoE